MSLRRGFVTSTHAARIRCNVTALLVSRTPHMTLGEHRHGPHWLGTMRAVSSAYPTPLQGIGDKFLNAIQRENSEELLFYYNQIKLALSAVPKTREVYNIQASLKLDSIRRALNYLAGTKRIDDAVLAMQILEDCPEYFGVSVDAPLLSLGLVAIQQSAEVPEAHGDFFRRVFHKFSDLLPNKTKWHVDLGKFKANGQITRLRNSIRIMKLTPDPPNITDYIYLIEALFECQRPPTIAEIIEILDDIAALKLARDDRVLETILKHCRRLRLKSYVKTLSDEYEARFKLSKAQIELWIEELKHALEKEGRGSAMQKLDDMRRRGFRPDERTLCNLLGAVKSYEEMKHLEKALKVRANRVAWSILIKNALDKRGLAIALSLYDRFKAEGVPPDSAMVHPLLRGLCSSSLQEPSEKSLDQAMGIYHELGHPSADSNSRPSSGTGPDTGVFNTLLRALTSSSNKTKYFPIALALLDDMYRQQVSLDSMTAASIAVLFIRSATSFEAASRAYHMLRTLKRGMFDSKAYTAVLHAYCQLSFGPHSYPPAHGYFEIVQDMQREGYPMTRETYTILLKRYGALAAELRAMEASPERENLQKSLDAAVRRTHDVLILDASITPDIPLWNQLMDAYNRVGSFESCLQVWKSMTASGQYNNASVSIILDACGYAGAYDKATSICSSLLESGLEFNRRNWNAWIECLCRLGRLDIAMKTVCLEMARQREDAQPDQSTVEILLKFASRTNQEEEVRSRIKRYLPELWSLLPAKMRYYS